MVQSPSVHMLVSMSRGSYVGGYMIQVYSYIRIPYSGFLSRGIFATLKSVTIFVHEIL